MKAAAASLANRHFLQQKLRAEHALARSHGTTTKVKYELTYIDHHSLAKVVIVHHRVKVMLSGVLRILMDALVFVSGELGK